MMKVQTITHTSHLATVTVKVVHEAVPAGFPSPAQDYFAGDLNLNEHLIPNPTSTYLVRVTGQSMIEAGISDGDELLVDRSIEPKNGHVVIAVLDGELTVKRLKITAGGVVLSAENPTYPNLHVAELSELEIWGVVTRSLHNVDRA